MALRHHKSRNTQLQSTGSFLCLSQGIAQGDDIQRRNTNHVAQNVHRDSITVEARRQLVIPLAWRSACEDLLHASTPPQVETARAYELAKCRGNERWPPSPPDRRDRSRSSRGRSTTRRPVTAPLRYSLRQEWNLSLKKAKRILDTKTIRRAPALQSRAEPAL